MGDRLQRRARDVGARRRQRRAGESGAGAVLPVRRAEASERRHEADFGFARSRRGKRGQRVDVGEPHQRRHPRRRLGGDGNVAFECVGDRWPERRQAIVVDRPERERSGASVNVISDEPVP